MSVEKCRARQYTHERKYTEKATVWINMEIGMGLHGLVIERGMPR